jgi:hypothetical protein
MVSLGSMASIRLSSARASSSRPRCAKATALIRIAGASRGWSCKARVRPSVPLAAALRRRDASRRTRDGAATTKKLAGVGALRPSLHKFCKILNIQIVTENGFSHMIRVSAAEFQRNIGRYQDLALTQPVAVTRNGRERTVMISVEEYYRLKRRDRRVLGLDDFTDADIAALEQSRAPESSKAFDDELSPS